MFPGQVRFSFQVARPHHHWQASIDSLNSEPDRSRIEGVVTMCRRKLANRLRVGTTHANSGRFVTSQNDSTAHISQPGQLFTHMN